MRELLEDLSQRTGRIGEREFHILRVRRSKRMHSQLLRRNQFRGAHVGGVPSAGESAIGGEWQQDRGFH
jgi:hypothetical protein